MSPGDILVLVLPSFGIILAGWAAARFHILAEPVGDALGSYVFTIALPLLLVRTLAKVEFPAVSPWPLWLTYFAGVIVAWLAGEFLVRRLFGRDARSGVIGGLSASFSNLVLLGIPITFTVYGDAGAVPLLLIIAVHLPVMAIVTAARFEGIEARERGGATDWRRLVLSTLKHMLKNPLIIGIYGGLAVKVSGLPITGVPGAIIDQIANTGVPCALFTLGLGLRRYGIRENFTAGLMLTAVKVAVLPTVVFFIATRFSGMPPLWVAVATVCAASPTGVNPYLFATRHGAGHGIASNTMTIGSIVAVATTTFWMWVVGTG
jgi:predicted permease